MASDSVFSVAVSLVSQRVFAVVPIVPGLAFALGSYSPGDAGGHSLAASLAGAMAIPLALWLVSIGVAYLAVFRLVLRRASTSPCARCWPSLC